MSRPPTYEDIIAVMAQASIGNTSARVVVSDQPDADDKISSLAISLNILLDDLNFQQEQLRRSLAEVHAQQETIRRLWTPLLTVADHVLLLPIVGWIDADRARQMMEIVLERIHQMGARAVIIDLTGVSEIGTHAAGALGALARAAHLLGAEVVIAGLSAAVAQAMTGAEVDFRNTRTEANLARAIRSSLMIARSGKRNLSPQLPGFPQARSGTERMR